MAHTFIIRPRYGSNNFLLQAIASITNATSRVISEQIANKILAFCVRGFK